MDPDDVATLIAALREEGSDNASVEAKSAAEGFPEDLTTTISAFANTPGGGTLLLGLDEHNGFEAVPVYDVVNAQTRLAASARTAMEPPVRIDVALQHHDDVDIVVARVHEAPLAAKPVRVRASRKAHLRAYDGDYEMSQVEEQAFIANRDHPRFDREPVAGATLADLDQGLLTTYRETCRTSSSTLARFSDVELLLRTGVTARSGVPTTAGLLALGTYPQQFFPNAVIQASTAPDPGDPPGTRASDTQKFDGPLPVMLEEATRWVRRNTRTRVRFGEDGHGLDEPEYPAEAIRELVSNVLVHRDLGPHALAYATVLKLERHQFVLSNPGGLWGITVDRLGQENVSSARNDSLLRIAQNVRTSDGRRVVEGISSGIPTVLRSLDRAGMVRPVFHDQGIRFVVRVPNHALLAQEDLAWLTEVTRGADLTDTQRHALVAMRHGRRWTNSSFRSMFPRDSTTARSDLQRLVEAGMAVAEGERGQRTYSIVPELVAVAEGGELRPSSAARRPSASAPTRAEGVRAANAHLVLECLRRAPAGLAALTDCTGLTVRQVEYALALLREQGDVVLDGRRGRRASTYRLSASDDGSPT